MLNKLDPVLSIDIKKNYLTNYIENCRIVVQAHKKDYQKAYNNKYNIEHYENLMDMNVMKKHKAIEETNQEYDPHGHHIDNEMDEE